MKSCGIETVLNRTLHKLFAFSFNEIVRDFLTVDLVFLIYAIDKLFQIRQCLVSHVFVPIH